MKRVLVTGARDWPDATSVEETLLALADELGGPFVIVHGACPTGADAMADAFAVKNGWPEPERHPANWARYGRGAGPKRNGEMVATSPDLVQAFLLPGSRGTADCICKSKAANLEVRTREGERP